MKKHEKILSMALGAVLLLVVGSFALLAIGFASDDGESSYLTQEEVQIMRDGLGCDRLTKEFRPTDKYCSDPDQYYEDIETNVIEPAF